MNWSLKKSEEIKEYLEKNEYENIITQNLWDAVQAVLRGEFIVTQAYLRKQEVVSNKQPNLIPKELEKEKQHRITS